MDRVTEQTMRGVFAAVEAAAVVPPDSLEGPARAMFETIAASNRMRPWSAAHVDALAHFCRIVLLWEKQLGALEVEGVIVDGKSNPRLKVMGSLANERGQLAKMLGLSVAIRSRFLGGDDRQGREAREVGSAIAKSREDDTDGLLS